MKKEEIEKAKSELRFFNEGDYITRDMSECKEILEEYIEYLENKLEKVAEYCKRFEYETEPIADDDYLTERALVCGDILEIIEGERNNEK